MKKLLLFGFIFCLGKIHSQICFGSQANHAANTQPMGVVCADFTGDSIPDIISMNYGSADISLLAGNGSGGFSAATNTVICSWMIAICTADFNGDHKADLAVACGGSMLVEVMLGTGAGGFSAATSYSTTNGTPVSLATNDFNEDGKTDLLASNMNTHDVSVLFGDGSGGFSTPANFLAGYQPNSTTTADLNKDGHADIITANRGGNNVSVLLGDGTGNFSPQDTFAVGTSPYWVTATDLNGDGNIDLATANNYSNNVSVLLGDGLGHFGMVTNYGVGSYPNCVGSGDFDSDGYIDLVASNAGLNNVSVLKGNGAGVFAAAYNVSAHTAPSSLYVADLNNDGAPDIAVSNNVSNDITTIMNCVPTSTCHVSVSYALYQDTIPGSWNIIPQYSAQVDSAVWDWGDGTVTSGFYPSHIYTTPNFYNKCVTVYGNCGDSAITCHNDSVYRMSSAQIYVNVIPPPSSSVKILGNKPAKIYPNPAQDIFYLETTEYGVIRLFDVMQQPVVTKKIEPGKNSIPLGELNAGMYQLEYDAMGKKVFYKLIVTH